MQRILITQNTKFDKGCQANRVLLMRDHLQEEVPKVVPETHDLVPKYPN